MSKKINIHYGGHNWLKTNLVGLDDQSDLFECSYCGIKGKRPAFSDILYIDGRIKDSRIASCDSAPEIERPKRLKVTRCTAHGKAFENLKPGSEHEIVFPPEGQDEHRGWWVMGVGEPVLLLKGEYEILS